MANKIGVNPSLRRLARISLMICLLAVFFAFLPFASPVNAQASKGHSGGQHQKVGLKHIELVGGAADTALIFVVTTDQDKPVRLSKGMVFVSIQQHGRTTNVPVVLDGLSMVAAKLKKPLQRGSRIFVSVRLAKGDTLQANFTAN